MVRSKQLQDQNQGARALAGEARASSASDIPLSSIRTVTVGFGIAPNLLTPPIDRRALAGLCDLSPSPPVGTSTPPRERLPSGFVSRTTSAI